MKDEPRWYVVGGNEWRLRSGDTTAKIWLADDNITYKSEVRLGPHWADEMVLCTGENYCLKNAKEVCLEAIRLTREHLDDTV